MTRREATEMYHDVIRFEFIGSGSIPSELRRSPLIKVPFELLMSLMNIFPFSSRIEAC